MDTKLITIYELCQELSLKRDVIQVGEATLEIAEHVLGLQETSFFLVDEKNKELVLIAKQGDLPKNLRYPLDSVLGIAATAARSSEPVLVPDTSQDHRYLETILPVLSELAIPVHIKGRILGVINVSSPVPNAFTQTDQEILTTLASQAALTLENIRIYKRVQRRAEVMTSVNEVARRISATLDKQEALDLILCAVEELVPCTLSTICLWDDQRQALVLQVMNCKIETGLKIGNAYPLGEGLTGWVVRNKRPLLLPDIDTCQEIRPDPLPEEPPFKAYIGLPLFTGDELVGILELTHIKANAFKQTDLEPLEALAGQAAVVIHNVQLYTELFRHHREHSVLYSVIESINRPLDLRDTLEHALERVLEVTKADGGGIRLVDFNTDEMVLAAHRGLSEAYVNQVRSIPISREITGWVARNRRPTLSEDMQADTRVSPEIRELLMDVGHRSLAQVPLIAQDRVVGTLGLTAKSPRFFNDEDLKLLVAISQQLGIAIYNAKLFEDTQRKANRLAALNAVAAAINQSLDLDGLLENAVDQIVKVIGVDAANIRLLDIDNNTLELVCQRGLSPEYASVIQSYPLGVGISGRVALTGEPELVADVWAQKASKTQERSLLVKEGLRARVEVPLRSRERVVGTLGLASRTMGAFEMEDVDLLISVGHQLGVAIDNARLRQEALQAERLAAVGRVATSVAHDLRSPLGGIMRSAEFLARPELSTEMRKNLSQAVVSLSRRLINTSQEILDYVQGGRLSLKLDPCSVVEFLEEVLTVLQGDFSDRGIEVRNTFDFRGKVIMDANRMAQVIYNIAANARDAMPEGGTFSVETHKAGEWIEMRFSDTGPGVPTEVSERIFEPFFTYGKREGAGLGLAIARRIIEEHGGAISLTSSESGGARFVVTLPAS